MKVKISFTGDAYCTIPKLYLYNGEYNFDSIFLDLKKNKYLEKSACIVTNLETPIAGDFFGYSDVKRSYKLATPCFNTPIEFVKALKKIGITIVSTANNHCLDKGINGLEKTLDNLDSLGIKHVGTYKKEYKGGHYIIDDISGIKIAFFSYTYGTNAFANGIYLNDDEKNMVDLFQEQEFFAKTFFKLYHQENFLGKILRFAIRLFIKRPIYEWKTSSKKQLKILEAQIKDCKLKGADMVILCAHIGGQFNFTPTRYAKKIMKKIATFGVDAVIGNHEHTIQKCEVINNTLSCYALGDFISEKAVLLPPYNKKSDISVIFNLYISKNNKCCSVDCYSATVVKSVFDENRRGVKIVVLADLINNEKDEKERQQLIREYRDAIISIFSEDPKEKIETEYFMKKN